MRVELIGPNGDAWTYGPSDAESTIMGPAAVFYRVGAQRLTPTESGPVTAGPFGEQALQALRNYAAWPRQRDAVEPERRVELLTYGLQDRCSTN